MSLTGEQFEKIQTALLDASERVPIQTLLPDEFFSLHQDLEDVEDSEVIPRLVVWAIEHESLPQLLAHVAQLDSDNLALQQLASDVRTWISANSVSGDEPIGTGDKISVTVGEGSQFVVAGKNVQQTVYYVQPPRNERERRNRQAMLKLVDDIWVKGVLEKSLYNEVLIDLGKKRTDGAVANPWDMVIHVPQEEDRQLPKGTRTIDVFDEVNQSLLILGEPGSGKTTMLLELTRDAISRAQKDDALPIPAVFNLSSWTEKKHTLEMWIIDEVNSKYGVPKKIVQKWVENDEILLLLDGLDEVKREYRHECVAAINAFRQDHLVAMAVCSRTVEYEALATQLNLYGAVTLQPLTSEQIDDFVNTPGNRLQAVEVVLRQDVTLREFVESPLILNVMTVAYRDKSVEEIRALESTNARRKHLFDAYISKMFAPTVRTVVELYSEEQTIYWLHCLAESMIHQSQTIFLLELLQPSWLHTQPQQARYVLVVKLFVALLVGSVVGLIATLLGGWAGGLFLGLLCAAVTAFTILRKLPNIEPLIDSDWSWLVNSRVMFTLLFGFLFGLVGGLLHGVAVGQPHVGLAAGLRGGLVWGLYSGLFMVLTIVLGGIEAYGLHPMTNETMTVTPNQGIKESARNGLLLGLLVGFFVSLLFGLTFWLLCAEDWPFLFQSSQFEGLKAGLLAGLCAGLFTWGYFGGLAWIQHYVLRLIMFRCNNAPLNYTQFLDYCNDRIFLYKVGGGYIFIHRMLMEHFAEMSEEDIGRIVGSPD